MFHYLLRRILLALPTLLILSLITFGLSKCSPIDPVVVLFGGGGVDMPDPAQRAESYRLRAGLLGLDKPAFYCTFSTALFPDTLNRVFPPDRRQLLQGLALEKGDWPVVQRYEKDLWAALRAAHRLPDTLAGRRLLLARLNQFQTASSTAQISQDLAPLDSLAAPMLTNSAWAASYQNFQRSAQALVQTERHWARVYQPAFRWHGADNQYHRWLTGFLKGDLGLSFTFRSPVSQDLYPALASTLLLNGTAIFLAYALSIPLGIMLARQHRRRTDRWGQWALLFLYSMPVFWMGSLLILLLATPGIGLGCISGISIEPWQNSGKTLIQWAWDNGSKFILPVATLTLHALAALALQMRGGMLEVLGQDYIRTARAKGLDEDRVQWRHAFRNALFPLITIFGSILPQVLAGSLVVEYLFNFPGMGVKTQQAFFNGDPPVLLAIFMLAAVLTILGSLLADLLYAWADPRVRFSRQS